MKKHTKRLTLDQMKAKVKKPNRNILSKLTSGIRGGTLPDPEGENKPSKQAPPIIP
ncbi:MAG: hypothetical protein AAGA10_07240 [Bacteroidota bacterium]